MLDSKMLLIILAIALLVFGTKRLRSIGSDLGGAIKGFKQAIGEGESEATVAKVDGGGSLPNSQGRRPAGGE
jgi:sec-independent protein translocase protein TatA